MSPGNEKERKIKGTRHRKLLPIRKMFHSPLAPPQPYTLLVQRWPLSKRAQGLHDAPAPQTGCQAVGRREKSEGVERPRGQVPSCTSCYPSPTPQEHPDASCFVSLDGEWGNVEATTTVVHLPDTPGYDQLSPPQPGPVRRSHTGRWSAVVIALLANNEICIHERQPQGQQDNPQKYLN